MSAGRESDALFRTLGIYAEPHYQENISPTDSVSIVVPGKQSLQLVQATWWLALKPGNDEQAPWLADNRWQTFNTRAEKITQSPMHLKPPRSFRVVIPASGYYEWQQGQAYQLRRPDQAIAFGGLAKYWPQSAQFSCSIVTLPGHPALAHIHGKSLPLMLNEEGMKMWLDRSLDNRAASTLWERPESLTLSTQAVNSSKDPQPTGELNTLELNYEYT